MFERVDLQNQNPLPPQPSSENKIDVGVDKEEVQVPIKKETISNFEVPPPPPQKADLKKIPGRKRMWIITSIIVGVLVVGIGGVFAAYRKGYIDIPFLNSFFLNEDVLGATINNLTDIESGHVSVSVAVAVEPKTDKAVTLKKTGTDSYSSQDASKAAQMKSDVSQYRTALALYYDDNKATYPAELSDVVGYYLSSAPSSTSSIVYKATTDKTSYTLTGSMDVGDETYTYSVNSDGDVTDTFPPSATASLFTDEDFFDAVDDGLPTDVKVEGTIDAFVGKKKDEGSTPNALLGISGSYSAPGTTFEIDVEVRSKNEKAYIKVNTFPSLFFFDFSALTGTWIEISEDGQGSTDLIDYGVSQDTIKSVTDQTSDKRMKKILESVLKRAIEHEAVSIDRKYPTERVDGKLYDKFGLSFNLDKVDETILSARDYVSEWCKSNPDECDDHDVSSDDEVTEALEQMIGGPDSVLSQIVNAGEYLLWVGRDGDSYRLKTNTYVAFLEDSVKFTGKQLHISFDVTLDHINEDPDVETPKDAIDFDEASRIMAGFTEEEWTHKQQVDEVRSIRRALDWYYDKNERYPDDLSAIVDTSGNDGQEVSQVSPVVKLAQVTINPLPDLSEDPYAYLYMLSETPLDKYTEEEFPYANYGDNYALSYQIENPDLNSADTYSFYDDEKFVKGMNTADKYVISKEGVWDDDTDSDGLTGKEEYDYGTDPTKRDTDSDLASDFDEIQSGTDPLDGTSRPDASTSVPIILTPTTQEGSVSPNTGSAAGGTVITLGVANPRDDVAVFFGERRAYVKSKTSAKVVAVLPGYEDALQTGTRAVVLVKVINNGKEYKMDSFTYTGAVKIDTDGDGLTDAEEIGIGTSSTLSDTDQDGYTDFQEVSSGNNPLVKVVTSDISIEKQMITTMFSGTEGSMTFWAKVEDWDANDYMYMLDFIDDTNKERLTIRKSLNYLSFIVFPDDPPQAEYDYAAWSANDILWVDDTWQHIAITWKQGEVTKLYVDGVQLSDYIDWQSILKLSSSDTAALTASGELYLQGRKASGDGGNVEIENFEVSNTVLSASDIKDLYEAGV